MSQDRSLPPSPTQRFTRLAQQLAQLESGGWDLAPLHAEVAAAQAAHSSGAREVAQHLADQVMDRVTDMLSQRGMALPREHDHATMAAGVEDIVVMEDMSSSARAAVQAVQSPTPAPATTLTTRPPPAEATPTEALPAQSATVPVNPGPVPVTGATRLLARDGQLPGSASVRIATQLTPLVERSVSDRVAQAVAALRAEFAARPVPLEDEALAKEIEYHVERIAAERGWCSLADVQSLLDTQRRDGDAPPLAFARLEVAIAEFVRQTQSQQERFLSTFAERIAHGTHAFAQRLAGAAPVREGGDAESALDPVPVGHVTALHAARAAEPGTSSTFSRGGTAEAGTAQRQSLAPRPAVPAVPATIVVGAAGGERPVEANGSGQDSVATVAVLRPAGLARSAQASTGELAPPLAPVEPGTGLRPVAESIIGAPSRGARPPVIGDADLVTMLRALLPDLLQEPAVRNRILAIVAVEAFTTPGSLGELSGLRSFLRQELRHAAANLPAAQPA